MDEFELGLTEFRQTQYAYSRDHHRRTGAPDDSLPGSFSGSTGGGVFEVGEVRRGLAVTSGATGLVEAGVVDSSAGRQPSGAERSAICDARSNPAGATRMMFRGVAMRSTAFGRLTGDAAGVAVLSTRTGATLTGVRA